jgi:hypothetical protein
LRFVGGMAAPFRVARYISEERRAPPGKVKADADVGELS